MTDKRAEALERARALRARYDSATTVHPSTHTQLADARELLALHAENENLKAEPIKVEDREVDWAFDILRLEQENEKLTAENKALLQRIERLEAVVNAVKYFKENELTAKRGRALRGLWNALLELDK